MGWVLGADSAAAPAASSSTPHSAVGLADGASDVGVEGAGAENEAEADAKEASFPLEKGKKVGNL